MGTKKNDFLMNTGAIFSQPNIFLLRVQKWDYSSNFNKELYLIHNNDTIMMIKELYFQLKNFIFPHQAS